MAEPQPPLPPTSGVPYQQYPPPGPTQHLPADPYGYPPPASGPPNASGYGPPGSGPPASLPPNAYGYGPPGYGPPASGPPNAYGYSGPPASGPPQPTQTNALVPYSVSATPVYSAQPEQVIAQIGDIQVTSTTVRTPTGQFPLRGSQWQVVDAWTVSQRTPGWAIALAIIGFFCLTLFSLLFLLVKESVVTGIVQVQVSYGRQIYVTRIPVTSQQFVQSVYAQVNYVRALAAM